MSWIKNNWSLTPFNKNYINFDKDLIIDQPAMQNVYLYDTMTTLRKTDHVRICKVRTIKDKEVCVKFLSDADINYGSTDVNFVNIINRQKNCIKTKSIALLSDDYKPYTHLIETEYANSGSLYLFLKTQPKKSLVWALLFEIIKGIGLLHSKGILHNDIKPSNVLITLKKKYYSILFNDFNIINSSKNQKVCTPEYTSPEIIENNIYSTQSDIWAFGVVLYELFAKKLPFGCRMQKLSPEDIFDNILKKEPVDISLIPSPFDTLVKNCLIKDINLRPASVKDLFYASKINPDNYTKKLSLKKR